MGFALQEKDGRPTNIYRKSNDVHQPNLPVH
jgi:hypothetical protein